MLINLVFILIFTIEVERHREKKMKSQILTNAHRLYKDGNGRGFI